VALDRPFVAPNGTVTLYDGPVVTDRFGSRAGTVVMTCVPEPRLRWQQGHVGPNPRFRMA